MDDVVNRLARELADAIAAHLTYLLDQLRTFSLSAEQNITAGHRRQRIEGAQPKSIDALIFQPLLLAPGQIRGHRFCALIAGIRFLRQAFEQYLANAFRQIGDMDYR